MTTIFPITVALGFFGAGKTTLLSLLRQHPDLADSVVLLTQHADDPLDHRLLREACGAIDLHSVPGPVGRGPDAAAIAAALRDALCGLAGSLRGDASPVRHVLVEASALTWPEQLLATLADPALEREGFHVAKVVTLVDATNTVPTLAAHQEAEAQVAVADHILLTNADGADEAALAACWRHLRDRNPSASTSMIDLATARARDLSDLIPSPDQRVACACRAVASARQPETRAVTCAAVTRVEPVTRTALAFLSDFLRALRGPDLLRVKGVFQTVETPDSPAVLDAARWTVRPIRWLSRWPTADRRSGMLIVTRDMPQAWIERLCAILDWPTDRVP